MAAARSEEQFLCSICLDLFTEPVTTPCGHNFCRGCLSQHWDTSAPCRCPLCNERFLTRPHLRVNTMFSEMVSQFKQEAGECGPGEVSCDHCSAPKLKAVKSCLVCLSSYCESHLQPHLSVSGLKSHQLMEPVDNMEDRLCPHHHKPLELFCSSDHSLLCTMCALLEHQSHKFVSLKEESTQRKASLQQKQQQSHHLVALRRQKIQEIEKSVQLSQREADREESTGLKAFTALMESVQSSRQRFIKKIQDKQKQTQTEAEEMILKLNQEICELEQRSTEAEELLRSEDHLHFLQHCPTLPPAGLKDCSSVTLEPLTFEGTAAKALSELEENLRKTLIAEMKKQELQRVQQFAVDLTLDTNTAHHHLSVSEDMKQVHHTPHWLFPDFLQICTWFNILTKQSFSSGRFYFEVQVKDKTEWILGVAKESVSRGRFDRLNSSDGYWRLCLKNKGVFISYNEPCIPVSLKCPPQKVGVFVDYGEGLVSFYDVDSADLIYSFTGCLFSGKLVPFLNPCDNYKDENSAPLVLTAVEK